MSTRRAAALAILVLIPLVAGAQERAQPWPDGWRATSPERCHAVEIAGGLPALEKLGEVAAIPSLMGWVDTPPPTGFAVWSIAFDSTGAVRRVANVATDLPDSVAKRATSAVANVIDAQPPGAARTMQLRLQLRGGPRFSLAPSELCDAMTIPARAQPAVRTTQEELVRVPASSMPMGRDMSREIKSPESERTSVLRVHIAPSGEIADTPELLKPSGDASVDAAAWADLRRAVLLPALLDRMPVSGYATFTFKRVERFIPAAR